MNNFAQRVYRKLKRIAEAHTINNIIKRQLIAGKYKRVYQFHIRKTGGTSVNMSFFDLAGDRAIINKATNDNDNHRAIADDKIFVRWNKRLLQEGKYYYGVSHIPYYELALPEQTFTFSILRHPVARIISEYRWVTNLIERGSTKSMTKIVDKKYMGSLDDFVEYLPREELLHQLYLFTPDYNIDAAETAIRSLTMFFSLENFNEGLQQMADMLDLPLQPTHIRKSQPRNEPVIHNMRAIEQAVAPEIELYNRLLKQTEYSVM